jgi:DNA invertase Pin-like site-specific DNA recombinase
MTSANKGALIEALLFGSSHSTGMSSMLRRLPSAPKSATASPALSMSQVGLYLRVSTNGQTTENQLRELQAVAAKAGWQVVEVFEDHGISGAKGRDKRPAFDRMLKAVIARKIDVVAAWSIDRIGRSLQHLVGFLAELQAVGCDLYLHLQRIDTTTPSGKAMFQMLGVFAEFDAP